MNIEEAIEYIRNCLDDEYDFKNATRKKDKEAHKILLTAYEKEKEKIEELLNQEAEVRISVSADNQIRQLKSELEKEKEKNKELIEANDRLKSTKRIRNYKDIEKSFISKDKIKAKIEEIKDKEKKCILFISENNCKNICMENCGFPEIIEVLQSLLEEKE